MSQYPSLYYPPNFQPQYGGPPDVLAPAKRASILMFILGPLLMLCGGCFVILPLTFSSLPAEQIQPTLDQFRNVYHMDPTYVLPALGIVILLPGIALLVLAIFVRRGGRASAITSMVLVGLILLKSILELPVLLLHPTAANAVAAMCGDLVTLAIFGMLFFWLLEAVRSSSKVAQAQQQYMAQYWQYQQNMQAYSGYGFPAQPPLPQGYPQSPANPPPLTSGEPTPPPTGE